jgi:hypothetical protein
MIQPLFTGLALAALTGAATAQSADLVAQTLGLTDVEVSQMALVGAPGQSAMATLEIEGAVRNLMLEPHSVRSDKYEIKVQTDVDTYEFAPAGELVTYRGEIPSMPGVQVAAGWLDDGLHALLVMPDGSQMFIEPLLGRMDGADASMYAVYADADVADTGKQCGMTETQRQYQSFGGTSKSLSGTAQGGSLLVAELGVDTDFQYFQDYGSVASVEARINTVINAINIQYENEIGLTHDITTIIVRSTSNDPYTTSDPGSFLTQFQNHWNSQQQGIQRDVAHLFTGKNINGGVIGIAFLGVICNTGAAYGLVESDCCGNFATTTDLSAHELGHNWNADHCSCSGAGTANDFTMNPFLTGANKFSPTQTIPAMISYANNRPCLDTGTGGSLCDNVQYGLNSPGNVGTLDSSTNGRIGTLWTAQFSGFSTIGSGLFIASATPTNVPFGGATLLVNLGTQLTTAVAFSGFSGSGTVNITVPNNPALVGVTVFCQVGVPNPGIAGGFDLSNGLEVTFCD